MSLPYFSGLEGNDVLESLNLQGNSMSAVGVSRLMMASCHVQHLDLSSNRLGDSGAIAVADGLKDNPTLKSIILVWNKIGFAGMEALALALQGNCVDVTLCVNKISSTRARIDSTSYNLSETQYDVQNVDVN